MIQYKKLQKLADHLRKGKLGHAKFNFAVINGRTPQAELKGNKLIIKPCGTNGCAMGELPIIFPKDWEYPPVRDVTVDEDGDITALIPMEPEPKFDCNGLYELDERVARFFGIEVAAADHLFYPNDQDTERFGGVELNGRATKLQVAKNIEAFIAKMKGTKRGK